jgi:hypothetical protein
MNMHRIARMALLASALLLPGRFARADLHLSITEDGLAAAPLAVGLPYNVPVTFDVALSGLDTADNQQLGALGATLYFDANVLGTPSSITAGPIVPDPTGFVTDTSSGADAFYDSFITDSYLLFNMVGLPITQNGLLFQFTVTPPVTSGSGTISFTDGLGNVSVFAHDTSGQPIDITAGPDLLFQIGALGAVPEPSSFLVVLFAGSVFGIRQGRLWLRRSRSARAG